MRVVIAPDKLKGSLSAARAAEAIAAGVRRAEPDAQLAAVPMADGGEGFIDAMLSSLGGRRITRTVTGPVPHMRVEAAFAMLPSGDTAVLEMSAAAGYSLVPAEERNPLYTTSFGVGELMRFAVETGCRRVIVGLGGSATCDAGIGCLQACGLPVLLADGEPTSDTEPLCGQDLERVRLIKRHRGGRVDGLEVVIAADVNNPLLGTNGAARVFAPQKGASPADVKRLEDAIEQLVTRMDLQATARQPGTGAAGGLGFALAAFFDGVIISGADLVLTAADFNARLQNADLCITAEGRFDATTGGGKACSAVAAACGRAGVPCVLLAGDADTAAPLPPGLGAVRRITPQGMPEPEAMARAAELLTDAAERLTRDLQQGPPR
ncbi:MAG: glycerate kinase [Phycisphaerae bacterium]